MKLIDTSAWIHQMRPRGDQGIRARVENLLFTGDAAWCPIVRLELWNGVNNDQQRKALKAYDAVVVELPITPEVWNKAYALASRCRTAGKTITANDVLIAACARHHGVEIESADSDFELIAGL